MAIVVNLTSTEIHILLTINAKKLRLGALKHWFYNTNI